nr:hypothetical protein [Tanacetum cinerariifolium]
MSWRHPDSVVTDPKPSAGSYSQADVRRINAHVVKLCDMPEGCRFCLRFKRRFLMILDLLFRGFPSIVPPAANVAIPDPTPEVLAAGTPNTKVMAKVKAFKKQKASTSGSSSSHVSKRTRSTTSQSSESTSRPSLFVENSNNEESDDDEDACVKIPLSTPIRSFLNSQGKAIMSDVTDTPSDGAGRSQDFTGPTLASQDPIGDTIDKDYLPFAPGPYYATYPEDGIVASSYEVSREERDSPHQPTLSILTKDMFKDPSVCKSIVDQFPTPREMVRIESLTNDRLDRKMVVLHCLMMTHEGELLARSRLPILMIRLLLLMMLLLRLRPRGRLVEAAHLVATTGYSFLNMVADHATYPLFAIIDLEPDRLTHPKVVPLQRLLMFLLSCQGKHNKEWVCVMVDMPNDEIMDAAAGLVTSVPSVVVVVVVVVVALSVQKKACGSSLSQDVAVTAPMGTEDAPAAIALFGV